MSGCASRPDSEEIKYSVCEKCRIEKDKEAEEDML